MVDFDERAYAAAGEGLWAGVDFDTLGEGLPPPVPRRPTRGLWRAAKAAFRLAGLDLRRNVPAEAPLDFRGRRLAPSEAIYGAAGRPLVLDVPVERLRSPLGFRLSRAAGSANVEVAYRIAEGRPAAEIRLPLEEFFGRWRPPSRAEFHGIPAEQASAALRSLPAWVPISPWSSRDPVDAAAALAIIYRSENAEHGNPLGVRHGHPNGGPWSRERIDVEVRRMETLVGSLRRHGFQPDSTLVGRPFLGADGAWIVLVQHGQHRAASAEAMGITHLPMLIDPGMPPVRRDEVCMWPLVRSGLFTPGQAMGVFDRMMAGEPPPGCPHPGSPDRLGWQAARGNGSAQGS